MGSKTFRMHLICIMTVLMSLMVLITILRIPYRTVTIAEQYLYISGIKYNEPLLEVRYYITGMAKITDKDGNLVAIVDQKQIMIIDKEHDI